MGSTAGFNVLRPYPRGVRVDGDITGFQGKEVFSGGEQPTFVSHFGFSCFTSHYFFMGFVCHLVAAEPGLAWLGVCLASDGVLIQGYI